MGGFLVFLKIAADLCCRTGRWRTHWVVDQLAGKVNGTINVDVHYYEQGNVQLATKHTTSFPYPTEPNGSQSIASQIVTTISKIETNYHLELNDVYNELGEKSFRAWVSICAASLTMVC